MKKELKIAIVGGGVTGLTLAYRLEQLVPGSAISLFELSNRVGGKIMTEHANNLVIERGPESVLARKTAVIDLFEELGLSTHIIERLPQHNKTFILSEGELHQLPTGMSGLIPSDTSALESSRLISKQGLERFKLEAQIPKREDAEDESIASFATRRFGSEMYEKMIEPLLSGIYGGDGSKLSILATFPQLREYEVKYGSVYAGMRNNSTSASSRYSSFVTLDQGIEMLTQTLAKSLTRTEIRLNTPITEIRKSKDKYSFLSGINMFDEFDVVILTTPAYANAKLLKPIDASLAELHNTIPYSSSTIVTHIYNKAPEVGLDGYGYIRARNEKSPIQATTWTSNKWPNRSNNGMFQIRAFLGDDVGATHNQTDEEILSTTTDELRRVLKIKHKPDTYRIDRYARAMPQYLVGHTTLVEKIEAESSKHPGLYLVGMNYHGVGIPDCIRSANTIANIIAEKNQ